MPTDNPINQGVNLLFQHPHVGSLTVDTGMDEISWGYNLNTVNWPTYGGEVVQILSVYIDDMQVMGTVRTYEDAEDIYTFFANYIAIATQGNAGHGSYDQTPMTMTYAPRGWHFDIQPLTVPGFGYSFDLVAPVWQMTAHIVDSSPDVHHLQDLISDHILNNENFALTGRISPDYSNPDTNPFQTYIPHSQKDAQAQIQKYADYYNSLIPSYVHGDFSSLWTGIGSKPNFGNFGISGTQQQTPPTPKKK